MKAKVFKRFLAVVLSAGMLALTGCSPEAVDALVAELSAAQEEAQKIADVGQEAEADETEETAPAAEEVEKTGDVTILFTSDIHCGVDQNFTLAGVKQVQDTIEKNGTDTLLVDNGDAIQGEPLGTVSTGESIIRLMNAAGYDIAIPGNHEFDYGMDRFLALTEMADFPYISCNFNKEGELVFEPYIIKEVGNYKIGFVGITTPRTLSTSTPKYFQDENGKFIYGFFQDDTGKLLYDTVQKTVDAVRAEGVDYVVVLAHTGYELEAVPFDCVSIIENTTGIDAYLDGHSHDTEQMTVKNKDGEDVLRSACGTKLQGIGYLNIAAEDGALSAGVYTWNNSVTVPSLFGIHNEISDAIAEETGELNETLSEVVAKTAVELTINDPEAVTDEGTPIRIVRRAETNLGDLCADAYRDQMGTDVALVNGGGIRVSIPAGDITLGDILKVHPFGNNASVYEVTGQQLLDALEWGARVVPEELGGFLQVSGLSYEIHTYINSSCTSDEDGMFTGVDGEYRVKNVKIGGEDLDLSKKYTVASVDYILKDHGDGYTMFDDATLLLDKIKIDNQVLMDYITETLGGVVGEGYENPYGEGRIVAVDEKP